MMKLGCIRTLTERGSQFIRDLVVERKCCLLAGSHGEGMWAEGTSPIHQLNASRGVSPTPRYWCDGRSGRIALSPGGTICGTRDVVDFDPWGRRTKSQLGKPQVRGEWEVEKNQEMPKTQEVEQFLKGEGDVDREKNGDRLQ